MNTRTDEPLDAFEAELLSELRGVVAQRAAESAPAPARTRHRHRWAIAGAAAAVAAGALAWNAVGQAPAAYALEEDDAGNVTVTVTELEDADGLEAAFAAVGIAADVTYLPDGQVCAEGRFAPADVDLLMSASVGSGSVFSFTLPAGALADGQTLVLELTELADGDSTAIGGAVGVADGAIGQCDPVALDVPAGQPAGGEAGTGTGEA